MALANHHNEHGPRRHIESPGETGIEIPDVAGEIIGYRAWKVIRYGTIIRLASATYQAHWPVDKWVEATCGGDLRCPHSSDGMVPGEDCSCGLYAARDRDHLLDMSYADYHNSTDAPVVYGQVGMVGKVIPGTQGWRAAKARVVKIFVPYESWKLGAALGKLYGVPYELDNWINPLGKVRR